MDHQNATHHCDEFLVSHVDSWTVVQDGSWTAVNPPLTGGTVETSVAEHDTTGGMAAKIAEAASIASVGIPVYVVEAGSRHALEALKGTLGCSGEDWVGTIIRHCDA